MSAASSLATSIGWFATWHLSMRFSAGGRVAGSAFLVSTSASHPSYQRFATNEGMSEPNLWTVAKFGQNPNWTMDQSPTIRNPRYQPGPESQSPNRQRSCRWTNLGTAEMKATMNERSFWTASQMRKPTIEARTEPSFSMCATTEVLSEPSCPMSATTIEARTEPSFPMCVTTEALSEPSCPMSVTTEALGEPSFRMCVPPEALSEPIFRMCAPQEALSEPLFRPVMKNKAVSNTCLQTRTPAPNRVSPAMNTMLLGFHSRSRSRLPT